MFGYSWGASESNDACRGPGHKLDELLAPDLTQSFTTVKLTWRRRPPMSSSLRVLGDLERDQEIFVR